MQTQSERNVQAREEYVLHHCLLQLSLRQGRKLSREEKSNEGLTKEMKQMHVQNAFNHVTGMM